jgi:soluble lytic murein transglycosylase-like protein
MGLGQLMPGTAQGLGVRNAYDTNENLWGTVRLIRKHLDNYRSDDDKYSGLVLALAAYNAGAGAVAKHGGVPPYKETQDYILKVTTWYRKLCGD